MAGVIRTVPSHSSRSTPRLVKAPRPPNAWIIYRSDKVHQLPPIEPGQPRRAQAEVSKMISNMWANEPEETRQEYERRAEEAKAAHALKYPGYRFKPMKKEERRAQREQERDQRQAKRRERHPSESSPDRASVPPAPLTASVPQYYASVHMPMNLPQLSHLLPPALSYPMMPFYSSQTRFGPAGPTPPVSAAASPSDSSSPSPPEVARTANEPQTASENVGPPLTTTSINSNTIQVHDDPAPRTIGVLEPTLYPQSFNTPAFASGQEWPHTSAATISNGGTLTPALTPSPLWQEVDSSQQQQAAPVTNQTLQDNVSFDLGPFHLQNLDSVISGSNDESLSAFLNPTNDPGIFQLTQLEPSQLLSNPNGEIEVSLGEFPPLDLSLFPQELFNFSEFSLGFPQADTVAPQESFLFNSGISVGGTGGSPQGTDDSLNISYNPDDYLDFGTSTNELPPLVTAPYVPPAGAANSSHRRAGGSWSKQFVRSQTPSPPRLTHAQ